MECEVGVVEEEEDIGEEENVKQPMCHFYQQQNSVEARGERGMKLDTPKQLAVALVNSILYTSMNFTQRNM